MVCVRLPAAKVKAGPSHGLGRGVRPLRSLRGAGRLLGVLGHEGAVAALASDTFENSTAGGNPYFETFDRFAVVLISAYTQSKPLGLLISA